MTTTFVRDPRVVAAAKAIAGTESRSGKSSSGVPSAADFHEAVVAVKAIDAEASSGLAAVLALHAPVRRYQAASCLDALTYPTPERAHQVNLRHSMRGFEALVIASPAEAPFVEVCGECSRVENAFEQHGYGPDDDHDDEQDGTELSMNACRWPCATYTAVAGAE